MAASRVQNLNFKLLLRSGGKAVCESQTVIVTDGEKTLKDEVSIKEPLWNSNRHRLAVIVNWV